jgi:protein phosphatase-4 regulatory subunit 3
VLTTSYHRQRDTIITWLDEETQMDLAISYQELEGAQETWQIICNIQGKDPDEMSPEEASDEEVLPFPKLDNLSEICEELQTIDQGRRNKALERLYENDEEFLKKLHELFEKLDDLESEDGLKKIFYVFKALINIADMKLYETLMSDEYYMTVFGALEYNPEISTHHEESKHRKVSILITIYYSFCRKK